MKPEEAEPGRAEAFGGAGSEIQKPLSGPDGLDPPPPETRSETRLEAGLYLLPGPIGNLGDLSRRQIEVLGQADLVAAEDTRRSVKLLNHLGLRKKLVSYREEIHGRALPKILRVLEEGGRAVFLSDAGAPVIADPGARLVSAVREAGFAVRPLPGPSAAVTALMGSGFRGERFVFGGFLPDRTKDRLELVRSLDCLNMAMVFFVAPHDLVSCLKDLAGLLGRRDGFLAREMTKIHEEYLLRPLPELLESAENEPRRGEITLVIGPRGREAEPAEPDWAGIEKLARDDPRPTGELASFLARKYSASRKEIYRRLLEFRRLAEARED
ncbi:MAG: 16S rRNA (cytidine(1402)-2'-O)-methyltransferase [Deltaproteobacteria bacterium]|nr:16S rRNA (cytidine(1402)-2'-O)-methyltransferase [Deltaproteobacteria bacterium]